MNMGAQKHFFHVTFRMLLIFLVYFLIWVPVAKAESSELPDLNLSLEFLEEQTQTVAIEWETGTDTVRSDLYFRPQGEDGWSMIEGQGTEDEDVVSFSAVLTGLKPGTAYQYFILTLGDTVTRSADLSFETPAMEAKVVEKASASGGEGQIVSELEKYIKDKTGEDVKVQYEGSSIVFRNVVLGPPDEPEDAIHIDRLTVDDYTPRSSAEDPLLISGTMEDVTFNPEKDQTMTVDRLDFTGLSLASKSNAIAFETAELNGFKAIDPKTTVELDYLTVKGLEVEEDEAFRLGEAVGEGLSIKEEGNLVVIKRISGSGLNIDDIDKPNLDQNLKLQLMDISIIQKGEPPAGVKRVALETQAEPDTVRVKAWIDMLEVTPGKSVPPPIKAQMDEMGMDKLTFDLALDLELDSGNKVFSLDKFALAIRDLGKIELGGIISNIEINPEDVSGSASTTLASAKLDALKLSYHEESLIGQVIKTQAAAQGVSVEDFKKMLVQQLQSMVGSFNSQILTGLIDPVKSFIENPGDLVIEIAPNEPLPLAQLTSLGPNDEALKPLNLKITSK